MEVDQGVIDFLKLFRHLRSVEAKVEVVLEVIGSGVTTSIRLSAWSNWLESTDEADFKEGKGRRSGSGGWALRIGLGSVQVKMMPGSFSSFPPTECLQMLLMT